MNELYKYKITLQNGNTIKVTEQRLQKTKKQYLVETHYTPDDLPMGSGLVALKPMKDNLYEANTVARILAAESAYRTVPLEVKTQYESVLKNAKLRRDDIVLDNLIEKLDSAYTSEQSI